MADIDLQDIHDTLVAIAFEGGAKILAADPNNIPKDTKLNSADIVTEADKAVEALVSAKLRDKYPSFEFVGEETFVPGKTRVTDAPTFIVDPIDGTTNFVHGFPHVCISLGFAVDRQPTVGVVYNPFLDMLYTAIRGQGAYVQRNASLTRSGVLSDQINPRLRLPLVGRGDASKAPLLRGLDQSLLAGECGSQRDGPNFEKKLRTYRRLTAEKEAGTKNAMVHSLRALGSAALNLCAVASGQLDAYWEGGCWAWDVCAGWCILTEAGGIMAHGNPGDWSPAIDCRVYLAVRGASEGQKELVEAIWDVIGEDGALSYEH